MTPTTHEDDEALTKLLCGESTLSAGAGSRRSDAARRTAPNRIATDCETAADDLVRLVLALVETLRELVERQAIRRVESGGLSDDEIERLGLTLMRLEQRMKELKVHFNIEDEDLALRLGSVEDFADVSTNESCTSV